MRGRLQNESGCTRLLHQRALGTEQKDPTATPSWIPPDANWLPWGSQTTPNILILRNMLPDCLSHELDNALVNPVVFGNQDATGRQRVN
jgi:hypothetical protein